MTNTKTNEDVLLFLDGQFDEICDYPKCEETRTHLLTCPACPATENMCEAHAQLAKQAQPGERVVFDNTCKHSVEMVACGKIRIKN